MSYPLENLVSVAFSADSRAEERKRIVLSGGCNQLYLPLEKPPQTSWVFKMGPEFTRDYVDRSNRIANLSQYFPHHDPRSSER